ncbi:hypothetical protein F8388_006691 [Cannabis sativa]|uniref:Uncharacterized protein n=1 Tax=Cannabis sativa TaxID=3483 RepID=A0A7J6HCM3_CANSA|nr:hypothetical protein F8388_006691 [Cannabis sativa]KAF4392835.1 hypothetical protein G4B88_011830 [Cannabis sativa]
MTRRRPRGNEKEAVLNFNSSLGFFRLKSISISSLDFFFEIFCLGNPLGRPFVRSFRPGKP